MSRRFVYLGLALGLGLAIVGGIGILPACYDVPHPACGFRCGAEAACPDDYTCAADNRCHLNNSDPTLVCGTPDAAPPIDAPDAPDAPDGPPDAPPDAPDAPPDAPDAPPDAPDAALDAPDAS